MKARAAKLGLIADFINGYPFKPHQLGTVGQPVVRIRQLMDPSASVDYSTIQVPVKNQIKDGDLIFAWSGSLAVKKWTRGPALLNQHLFKVVPHAGVDLDFLGYALEEVIPRLHAHGSTMQHVTRPELLSTQIQLPGLDQQRNIVDYLDREIAEMDAMNASLDKLIETLRHRARTLQTRLAFGLAADLQMTTSNSVLAGIPSSWSTTRFGIDFVESTERNGDNPIGPLLSISEYRGVELNERTDGQQASEDVSNYRVVHPGQLAANMMWLNHGGVGVSDLCGYISPDYKAFWISDRFEPRYVHYLFRSSRYIDFFEAIATGVRPNAKRVTKTTLGMTPVPMPPLDEQRRIADELDAGTSRLEAMIAGAERLKALLAERKSTLITEVVTGRKEVSAA